MNKKQYIIVGITILLFIIAIAAILLNKNNQESWMTQILNSQEYEITIENCNNKKTTLPKETVEELFSKWEELSNNGPWMGNNNTCYKTVTISTENNGIIEETEILLIDDTSLVLNINNSSTYYTNALHINNYLNTLFNSY